MSTKFEEDIGPGFTNQYVRVLEEAINQDYLEKWKVYAQLQLLQRELQDTITTKSHLRTLYDFENNAKKALSTSLADTKKKLEYEVNKGIKLEATITKLRKENRNLKAELKGKTEVIEDADIFVPEEDTPKPKRKPRKKKETIENNE